VRLFVIAITKKYPIEEKYDLISNMKRAARSSTRNIAEGFGRHHHQENLQFCRISRGSLYELIDDLTSSLEEQYISEDDYNIGRKLIEKSITILNGYIRYLNSKTNN